MTTPIPGPPGWPIIGNLRDVDINDTVRCFGDLAKTYGPIYKLHLGGDDRIFISSQELVNEVCTRKEFVKIPIGSLKQLQYVTPKGLFTAPHGQKEWGRLTERSPPQMLDVASQAVLRWARAGENNKINVAEDFTRLTLDTIALCAMDTRFNSFYKDDLDPFIEAMLTILKEAQVRSSRPAFVTPFMREANQKFEDAIAYARKVAADVIAKRRANASGTQKKDLVDAMVNRTDPVTGKKLSDDVIIDNMITFLIAGHETTSGLLSFLFYLLMTHPEAYSNLQQEVDTVIGKGPIKVEHLGKLLYVKASLREALRLHPPAAVWGVTPLLNDDKDSDEHIVLANKWAIRQNQTVLVLTPGLHRDPAAFGDDAEEFKPERMLDDSFQALPKNCWKPFGNGTRVCIGSDFALQEAILATAILFQKFDFRLADPDYKLVIRQTLTLKPHGLFMYAKLRDGIDSISLQSGIFNTGSNSVSNRVGEVSNSVSGSKESRPMSLFYGSNTETAKGLAERFAVSASSRGFKCTIKTLDNAINHIPTQHPVVFFVASYEEHPDNGMKFIEWLQSSPGLNLEGVKYSIFGCGNRDWMHTYQVTPILVDSLLQDRGAVSFAARGATDVSRGDILGDFESWQSEQLWPGISYLFGETIVSNEPDYLSLLDQKPANESSNGVQVEVIQVTKMTAATDRPKYHMEIELPKDVTYNVGDYLEVYPENSEEDLKRLLQVFKIKDKEDADPIIMAIFTRLELNQPATANQIRKLSETCASIKDKVLLTDLADEVSNSPQRGVPTVLQLLVAHPTIAISPNQLVSLLPSIRSRPYSISSSPAWSPTRCTLTWSLMDRPALTDARYKNEPPVVGLASGFLARLAPGDRFKASVRPGKDRFRPPQDLSSAPMIMLCIGAGIAPFRGFIQHRAEAIRRDPSVSLAPAVLYVGCRSAQEKLYAGELAEWEQKGAVKVRWVFSRPTSQGESGVVAPQGYVQDQVWTDRADVVPLWDEGARVYVCGSRALSQGVRDVVKRIYGDVARSRCGPKDEEAVNEWWLDVIRERYAVDMF
uniref:Bifunctional cytochrome P450/NADPH--P450 reductase n=1 Tax=Bionectria ochroleuca TaxID=29856 RepID=A0A8H7NPF5_BIOOC